MNDTDKSAAAGSQVTEADRQLLDKMANDFLRWPLPDSVCADLCATIVGYKHRSGTNLMTFTESKAMFTEVVLPLIAANTPAAAQSVEPKAVQRYWWTERCIEKAEFGALVYYADHAAIVAGLTTANELRVAELENRNIDTAIAWTESQDALAAARAEIVALRGLLEATVRAWVFMVNSPAAPIAATAQMDAKMQNALDALARTAAEYSHLSVIDRAELDGLRKDAALLDAFERCYSNDVQQRQIGENECEQELVGHYWQTRTVQSCSIREAIEASLPDAAMSTAQPEQGAK